MANQTLTYEQWRERYSVEISDAARQELHELHNIDADLEIETAMRRKYNSYIAGERDHG